MEKRFADVEALVAAAEGHFGRRVLRVRAPGGAARGALRIEFDVFSVIATRRDTAERTSHEASVLAALSAEMSCVPRPLGMSGDILFQSDLGGERLSQRVNAVASEERPALAFAAVRALFEIHAAARRAGLCASGRRIGGTRAWVAERVESAPRLAALLALPEPALDRAALLDTLGTPRRQFIKWDARAANAAVDETGAVGWFDFEYSGVRHGAEEFAWLIADECWPLPPEETARLIGEAFEDPELGWDAYRAYLELYTVFHAAERLVEIIARAKRKGWRGEAEILRNDLMGRNPRLAMRLCAAGAWASARHPLTEPMVVLFERVRDALQDTLTRPPEPPSVRPRPGAPRRPASSAS